MTDKKKRALITAGASGIGKAMASALEAAGHEIWVIDNDNNALDECPTHWRRDCLDVTDASAIQSLFERIETDWQGLDILCNNAGIAGPTALIEDMHLDGFRECLDVALLGSFLCLKSAIPIMKRQRHGVILFTSSTAGLYGFPLRAPYAAAKWGIHGLMKTVAMECGSFGIRANAIAPGSVEGPRIDHVIEQQAKAKGLTPNAVRVAYEGASSMRCFITAEEIAAMAVFLCSNQAKHISGQVIAVDGHTENPDPKV